MKFESLYKISEDFRGLKKLVDEGQATQEQIADTLEGVELMFNEKAAAVVSIANDYGRHAEMIQSEIDRLTDYKKALKSQQDSLKEYLRLNMEKSGIDKIECPLFKITLCKGRPIAVINYENELPDEYVNVKTTISPDKRKILADLKNGIEIPGAEISIGKTSILIK